MRQTLRDLCAVRLRLESAAGEGAREMLARVWSGVVATGSRMLQAEYWLLSAHAKGMEEGQNTGTGPDQDTGSMFLHAYRLADEARILDDDPAECVRFSLHLLAHAPHDKSTPRRAVRLARALADLDRTSFDEDEPELCLQACLWLAAYWRVAGRPARANRWYVRTLTRPATRALLLRAGKGGHTLANVRAAYAACLEASLKKVISQ